MKFTFKRERLDWHPDQYVIKLKRKACGIFSDEYPMKIWFSIEKDEEHDDGNPNCSWMNICLRAPFKSVEDAKIYLQDHTDEIVAKYKLHFYE
jgi:hypothetical protein